MTIHTVEYQIVEVLQKHTKVHMYTPMIMDLHYPVTPQ